MKEIKGTLAVPTEFKFDDDLIVGYANAPVVDRGDAKYRDLIPADTWLKALQEFFQRGSQINLMHRPIFVAETVKVEIRPGEGPLLYTRPLKPWVKEMIDEGILQGYSIEYVLKDYEELPSPDLDPRPIRKFKDFSVARISYVDEPMNPQSYFRWGGKMGLEDYSFVFDKEEGRVTVEAADEEAFARLAQLFDEGLKAAEIPVDGFNAIEFKMADRKTVNTQRKSLTEKIRDLLSTLGIKEDCMGDKKEAPDQLNELKEKLEALTEKVSELKVDEETLNSMREKIEALEKDFIPQNEGEGKGIKERLEALEQKQEEGETSFTRQIEALKASVEAVVSFLEKQSRGITRIDPVATKSSTDREEDFWKGAA